MAGNIPGEFPTRVAGTGDRWRITRAKDPRPGGPKWYAAPVEVHVYALPDRKHAAFFSHATAIAYAAARSRGARHSEVSTFEYSTLTRQHGRSKQSTRRAGYATREA